MAMAEGRARQWRGLSASSANHVRFRVGTLAVEDPDVSTLSEAEIRTALQALTGPEIDEALRHRLFPCRLARGAAGYAAASEAARNYARAHGKTVIAEADPALLQACLKSVFDEQL